MGVQDVVYANLQKILFSAIGKVCDMLCNVSESNAMDGNITSPDVEDIAMQEEACAVSQSFANRTTPRISIIIYLRDLSQYNTKRTAIYIGSSPFGGADYGLRGIPAGISQTSGVSLSGAATMQAGTCIEKLKEMYTANGSKPTTSIV